MNATAARTITEANLPAPPIQTWLDAIYAKIAAAAAEGKSRIDGPFQGQPWPTHEARLSVWKALRAQGYTIDFHPDAEPNNPEHDSYTLVMW